MGFRYTLRALWHRVLHGHYAVTRTAEDWDCVECERRYGRFTDLRRPW